MCQKSPSNNDKTMNRIIARTTILRSLSVIPVQQVRYARTKSGAAATRIVRQPKVLDDATRLSSLSSASMMSTTTTKKAPRKTTTNKSTAAVAADVNFNDIKIDEWEPLIEEELLSGTVPLKDRAAARAKPITEDEIVSFLKENTKLTDIDVVDLRNKVSWTNAMVFAVGASGRQLSAAAQALTLQAKSTTIFKQRLVELVGNRQCIEEDDDWVLVDCGSCIVQLFTPAGRAKYRLDEFWKSRPSEEDMLFGSAQSAIEEDDDIIDPSEARIHESEEEYIAREGLVLPKEKSKHSLPKRVKRSSTAVRKTKSL